jgi:hypothetical protein
LLAMPASRNCDRMLPIRRFLAIVHGFRCLDFGQCRLALGDRGGSGLHREALTAI